LLPDPVLPIIRYEVTDEVMTLPDPCTCGSVFRLLTSPQGRLDDGFTYNGLWVHPIAFRSPLGGNANVVEYQVRQTTNGADISLITKGQVDIAELRERIVRSLKGVGLDRSEVSITVVDRLERFPTGKLKRFIPLAA
jgi:phenylacetate-CoA ligase